MIKNPNFEKSGFAIMKHSACNWLFLSWGRGGGGGGKILVNFSFINFQRLSCDCIHNTCGNNCEKCCPGYNQKPWQPGHLGEGCQSKFS